MNENFKGFTGWLRGIFSESDGTPSASRLIMFLLGCVASAALLILCAAVLKSDVAKAALILSALPLIIAALTGFIVAPYSWNQLKNGVSDIFKAKDPTKP